MYNAVNRTNYKDPAAIEFTTIKEVLYLGMHNDVSFLIMEELVLYEQQSSFNPNMPLRMLQYAGNLYEKYVKKHKYNKFSSTLIMLPVPKLVVFYNGSSEKPDEMTLKLSESFPEGSDPDIEIKVRMLNVNYGRNRKLLESCRPLKEYSWLVEEIKRNVIIKDEEGFSSAIDKAITAMPDDYVIKPFLEVHRAEVKGMLLTEYNEAEQMELFKEDGRKEGIIEGRKAGLKEGIVDTLVALVKDGILTETDAAVRAGITEDAFRQKMAGK